MELYRTLPTRLHLVNWIMDYRLSDNHLVKASVDQVKLLQQEGLEGTTWYRINLQFLRDVYCAGKNDTKVLERGCTSFSRVDH